MRVKYLDISQTFFRIFLFLFMVQFSFFNRVEKIGILEFCCTSSRELPFTVLFLCAPFHKVCFAHWLPSVQSGSRRGGERHSRFFMLFFQLQGISLSTVELQQEWIFLKCLSFLKRKESKKKKEKKKSKPKWLSLAARHRISRTVHEVGGGGLGNGGGGVPTSKILKSVFAAHHQHSLYFSTRSRFRSIGFCNVYTYIYNYIEQSSSCLLEVFSVFRLLVILRDVMQFLCWPTRGCLGAPETHDTDLLEHRTTKGGFGLNKFLAG